MSSWLGKRVELEHKKTGEKRIGVVVEDGPTQTVFMSDDGEKLSAFDWYYRPARVPAVQTNKREKQNERS